jgi:hypothetical protein
MATRAVVMTKPRLCKVDSIEIDACMEETHTLNNTVTDHPVEQGFNISDHVRPEPDVVTLRCFISNTPLSTEQQTRAVQEGSVQFTTTSQQDVEIGAIDGRGADAFKKLKKLRDEGTLIKLVTTLKEYGNSSTEGMVVQSITVPRTTKNYDGLEFSITLKQIRIVKNRQTQDTQKVKDKRTPQKKHQGSKTTQEEVPESTAHKLKDGVSNVASRVLGQ